MIHRRKVFKRAASLLSVSVVFCTTYFMILPAVTLSKAEDPYLCNKEEHFHQSDCYQIVYDCPEASAVFSVNNSITDPVNIESNIENNVNDIIDISNINKDVINMEETDQSIQNPAITDELLTDQTELVEEQEFSPEDLDADSISMEDFNPETANPEKNIHVHDENCSYHFELCCEKEEHEHVLMCQSDPDADLESADMWESEIAGLPEYDNVSQRIIAIASLQQRSGDSGQSVQESARNFKTAIETHIQADGSLIEEEVKKGYTRYGQWATDLKQAEFIEANEKQTDPALKLEGSALEEALEQIDYRYTDWNTLFSAFVLFYANTDQALMPNAEDPALWMMHLAEDERIYTDQNMIDGDLVFYQETDLNGNTQILTGFWSEQNSGDNGVIICGDRNNQVSGIEVSGKSSQILGYAKTSLRNETSIQSEQEFEKQSGLSEADDSTVELKDFKADSSDSDSPDSDTSQTDLSDIDSANTVHPDSNASDPDLIDNGQEESDHQPVNESLDQPQSSEISEPQDTETWLELLQKMNFEGTDNHKITAVAKTQLGYSCDTDNIEDDQKEKDRYNLLYGTDARADYAFAYFAADFARFPSRYCFECTPSVSMVKTTAEEYIEYLRETGKLADDLEEISEGEIIFFKNEEDEDLHAGIFMSLSSPEKLTCITLQEGNVQETVIEKSSLLYATSFSKAVSLQQSSEKPDVQTNNSENIENQQDETKTAKSSIQEEPASQEEKTGNEELKVSSVFHQPLKSAFYSDNNNQTSSEVQSKYDSITEYLNQAFNKVKQADYNSLEIYISNLNNDGSASKLFEKARLTYDELGHEDKLNFTYVIEQGSEPSSFDAVSQAFGILMNTSHFNQLTDNSTQNSLKSSLNSVNLPDSLSNMNDSFSKSVSTLNERLTSFRQLENMINTDQLTQEQREKLQQVQIELDDEVTEKIKTAVSKIIQSFGENGNNIPTDKFDKFNDFYDFVAQNRKYADEADWNALQTAYESTAPVRIVNALKGLLRIAKEKEYDSTFYGFNPMKEGYPALIEKLENAQKLYDSLSEEQKQSIDQLTENNQLSVSDLFEQGETNYFEPFNMEELKPFIESKLKERAAKVLSSWIQDLSGKNIETADESNLKNYQSLANEYKTFIKTYTIILSEEASEQLDLILQQIDTRAKVIESQKADDLAAQIQSFLNDWKNDDGTVTADSVNNKLGTSNWISDYSEAIKKISGYKNEAKLLNQSLLTYASKSSLDEALGKLDELKELLITFRSSRAEGNNGETSQAKLADSDLTAEYLLSHYNVSSLNAGCSNQATHMVGPILVHGDYIGGTVADRDYLPLDEVHSYVGGLISIGGYGTGAFGENAQSLLVGNEKNSLSSDGSSNYSLNGTNIKYPVEYSSNFINWDILSQNVKDTSVSIGNHPSSQGVIVRTEKGNVNDAQFATVVDVSKALENLPNGGSIYVNLSGNDVGSSCKSIRLIAPKNIMQGDSKWNVILNVSDGGKLSIANVVFYDPQGFKWSPTVDTGEYSSDGINLLWNFPNADTVTWDHGEDQWFAQILAPEAYVRMMNGNWNANIIAGCFSTNNEGHFVPYNPSKIEIPENPDEPENPDKEQFRLPETGGSGTQFGISGGFLAMTLSAAGFAALRRKHF